MTPTMDRAAYMRAWRDKRNARSREEVWQGISLSPVAVSSAPLQPSFAELPSRRSSLHDQITALKKRRHKSSNPAEREWCTRQIELLTEGD